MMFERLLAWLFIEQETRRQQQEQFELMQRENQRLFDEQMRRDIEQSIFDNQMFNSFNQNGVF